MARLIERKLSALTVGTEIELLYKIDEKLVQIAGNVTDNDNESSFELITAESNRIVIRYSLVMSMNTIQSVAKKLEIVQVGSRIALDIQSLNGQTNKIEGIVSDNDGESSFEISLDSGDSHVIDYALVKNFSVVCDEHIVSHEPILQRPVFTRKRQPYCWEEDCELSFNKSDNDLLGLFSLLPAREKSLLQKLFNNYMSAVRANDRSKSVQYANSVRQTIERESGGVAKLSKEAYLLCSNMLYRVSCYDASVFAIQGKCYHEAAIFALKQKDYEKAAAYAAQPTDKARDLAGFAI